MSMSVRRSQVHKMAKDHKMIIRGYIWLMISRKLKITYRVKLKGTSSSHKSKITTSKYKISNEESKTTSWNTRSIKRLLSLRSLPVLNTDWGNKGYGMYKKIKGDGHDTPSSRKLHRVDIRTHLLKILMKMEYLHDDEDMFTDYSWERALSIKEDVYPEWCLEFFSTMYFKRGVDRTKLMTEKCVWFRLCGREHVLTLLKFAVLLGLYEPTWVIAEHLCKHALGLKENSLICGGHYVTKIAKSLGCLVNEEVKKCSEPIECEKWTTKMLANELALENYTLLQPTLSPPPTREERERAKARTEWVKLELERLER
ncbi:hypothetical protein Tco_0869570 [Tanacetum coccineum]